MKGMRRFTKSTPIERMCWRRGIDSFEHRGDPSDGEGSLFCALKITFRVEVSR